jgi:hypothetical protein
MSGPTSASHQHPVACKGGCIGPQVSRPANRTSKLLQLALRRREHWFASARTEPPLVGRLEPGDARRGRLVSIVNDKPEPVDDADIEDLVSQRQWAVVETCLRQYAARIVDNRPDPPSR